MTTFQMSEDMSRLVNNTALLIVIGSLHLSDCVYELNIHSI